MRLCISAALLAACRGGAVAAPTIATVYTPYRFVQAEGWRLTAGGDAGASRTDASHLVLDFTRAALVAHALLRAASRLVSTPGAPLSTGGVH